MILPLLPFLVTSVMQYANAFHNNSAILSESQELISNFFQRYNTTTKIDLVFVVDRSGSVPKKGWASMLDFVTNLLEHFIIDGDNTRVSIVTFSTYYTVNYNGLSSSHENKCALYHQIRTSIAKLDPYGYTALYDALRATRDILINSRPDAKKAVFVLTDGKSNVGPPPIRAAHDILSLEWSSDWPGQDFGPQIEIYAFGIHNAKLPELESIAYPSQNHTFLIPDFRLFHQLARSLHGDLQEDAWTPSPDFTCPRRCGPNALCTCGTGTGDYECVCKPGYEWNGDKCKACRRGYFKPDLAPTRCVPCSANSTTISAAASTCGCFPPYHQAYPGVPCTIMTCPALQAPENGYKFHVAGATLTEVANTGVACGNTAHNSCHFGCNRGYRLDSSPALVCHENGSWSGEPPECKIVDCRTIEDFGTDGNVQYVNGTTKYGSVARVTCKPGQVVFGDADRVCGEHARWSGTPAKCMDIMCPPLPAISYARTTPHSCTQVRQTYNAHCSVICRDGFQLPLVGAKKHSSDLDRWIKTCGDSGKWTGKDLVCHDTQPPTITCPDDVITYTAHGQNTTIIHWQSNKPMIRDNSHNFTYHVNGQAPSIFSVGLHVLQYVVKDAAENRAQCNRKVIVIGRHAKVKFCPGNITVANVTSQSKPVHWADPIFEDQDNKTLNYHCTRGSGDRFSIGVHHVHCYPDGFQDVVCHFAVNVSAKTCAKLPEPQNGVAVCYTYKGVQHLLQCSVMCNEKYEFAFPPLDYYYCDNKGNWVEKWPHCSRTYKSGRARLRGEVKYHYYGGSCQDIAVKKHILTMSRQKLTSYSSSICAQREIKCNLKDLRVHCHRNQPSNRELISDATVAPVSKPSDIDSEGQRSDSKGQRSFFEGDHNYRSRRSVRLGTDGLEGGGGDDDRNKEDGTRRDTEYENVTFSVEFSIEAEADVSIPVSKTMQTDLKLNLLDIEDEVNKEGLGVNTSAQLVADPTMDIAVAFVTNCSDGQILVSEEYSARCVNCPIGSFHNGIDCEPCLVGHYQDEEASLECEICPDNKTTVGHGAVAFEDCSDPCRPGTFSVTGLEPCDPCEFGTYQDQSGAKHCHSCPPGTGTLGIRTSFSYECIDECRPGYFSPSSGLEPCMPCLNNTYQPNPAARICHSCPDLKETLMIGANSLHLCIDIDYCQANLCLHGRCINQKGGFSCECDAGWTDDDCSLEINECKSSPCQHGATCIDEVNGYNCECSPGFTGEHCDFEIDECQSAPCLNGGSCVDAIANFTCYCMMGYGGQNCDLDLDDCAEGACVHGNCIDLVGGFCCECFPGFTGERCKAILDVCIGAPCKNGATCISVGSIYICDCAKGYFGPECETAVNECDSQPCLNDAVCVDDDADYRCRCHDGYAGKNCELVYGMEFDLVFKKPSITDYAIVTIRAEKLTAITVAFWMRSHDQINYGTPFSYGADSNWLHAECSNVFTLYDYGDQLFVNGQVAHLGLNLNDGHWNHVCISWEGTLGFWRVHLNGTLAVEGTGLASSTHIEGGGSFILGQEQDSIGGSFNRRESFIGELSQVQVFDYILSDQEIMGINDRAACMSQPGNHVLSWLDFPRGIKGEVELRTESFCLDVNECLYPDVYHCDGNHACTDLLGSYSCTGCQPGWTGDRCDNPLDECRPSPCKNNGTCVDGSGLDDWKCDCMPGYLGRDCYHEVDLCGSMPCLNNGTCIKMPEGYKCLCPASTIGDFCQKNYDDCRGNPCLNNATCVKSRDTFHCVCPDGFQGRLCDDRINFCAGEPCQNGGICHSYLTGFKCRCVAPWVGRYCTISDKPNCNHFPCLNNGTCVLSDADGVGYSCQCTEIPNTTWGPNCERSTICDSHPCKHGGTCVHLSNSNYACLCPEIFDGENCEIVRQIFQSVTSMSDLTILESSTLRYPDVESTTKIRQQSQDIMSTTKPVVQSSSASSSPILTPRPTPHPTSFPSMTSTAILTSVLPTLHRSIPEIQPTSVPTTSDTSVKMETSVMKTISVIDLCGVTACRNGRICAFDGNTTRCRCPDGFRGDNCDIVRKKVKTSYHVTVTLLMEYSDKLKESKAFDSEFKMAINQVYMPLAKRGSSKISIQINDIRKGSVVVDFTLQHVQYEDEPAITKHDMMSILREELKKGKLGDLSASQHFGFELQIDKVVEPDEEDKVYVMAGAISGCLVCGLVCLVIIVAVVRNRRRQEFARKSSTSKSYRKPYHGDVVLSSIANAAFEPDPDDDVHARPQVEEHEYADINYEPTPYAITTRADLERNNSFFKRMSQSHPLRGTIEECPKSGSDQNTGNIPSKTQTDSNISGAGEDNLAFENDYLEPIGMSSGRNKGRLPNTGFCSFEYPSSSSGESDNLAVERKRSSGGESSISHRTTPSPDDSYENLIGQIIITPSQESLNNERSKSASSNNLKKSSESLSSLRKASPRDSLKRSFESLRNIGKTSPKINHVNLKRNQNGRENAVFNVNDILLPIFEETRQDFLEKETNSSGAGISTDMTEVRSKTLGAGLPKNDFYMGILPLNTVIPTLELPKRPPPDFNPKTRALPQLPYRQEEERILRLHEKEKLQREYF